jgi:hypothetical protein
MEAAVAVCPPDSIYTLSYDDLVTDPDREVRALLEYCGLEFEQQCLSFHETTRTVKTASVKQVRKGIYASSKRSWDGLEEELAPLIQAFPGAA